MRELSSLVEPSTAPSCTPLPGTSISICCDGPCRSSNDSAAKEPRHERGWTGFNNTSPGCSPTGTSSHPPTADLREPYDGRLSSTVLRAPEGETPSGDSPNTLPSPRGWPRTSGSRCTSRPPPGPG